MLFFAFTGVCSSQAFVKTADLFREQHAGGKGSLLIVQPQEVDTIITRYILSNRILKGGMEGYRIQIYRSSARTAREESGKVRAGFITDYPDIPSYSEYAEPGYFIVKVGDFRTKMEGTKVLYTIKRKYPNAYMVPSTINFPGQEKK